MKVRLFSRSNQAYFQKFVGLDNLPPYSGYAMIVAAFIGVALPVINLYIKEWKYVSFVPTASTMGLAFIISPSNSVTLALGVLFVYLWEKKNALSCKGIY